MGRISSVNYEGGTAQVVYMDKDQAVTRELPLLSFEYCMPEVEDMVLVCHLPNGAAAGVILGRFWSLKNTPPESGRGLYRKDMSREAGKAMFRYKEGEDVVQLSGPQIKLQTDTLLIETKNVSGTGEKIGFVGNQVTMQGGSVSLQGDSIVMSGSQITISAGSVQISGAGDVILDGISLKNHTHTCSAPGDESSAAN
ncbi:MAG: hypothetical protein EOM28_09365 [Clostridia bacterium]|nr:hypothetical protein [Clostridia bacterium]